METGVGGRRRSVAAAFAAAATPVSSGGGGGYGKGAHSLGGHGVLWLRESGRERSQPPRPATGTRRICARRSRAAAGRSTAEDFYQRCAIDSVTVA